MKLSPSLWRKKRRHATRSRLDGHFQHWLLVAALSLAGLAQAGSLPIAGEHASPSAAKPGPSKAAGEPAWDALSPNQKAALLPLAPIWRDISASRRRKWIAMSADFANLSPAEQVTLHGRMNEWASLSTAQRNHARLTFAQSSTLTKAQKSAHWEAYQALSPEHKRQLADQAAAAPRGAAPAVARPSNPKLAAVPTTRSAVSTNKPATTARVPNLQSDLPASAAAKP